MAPPPSRMFTSYRALGYVSNHVPLMARFIKKRRSHLIVTVVGKSFLTFESNRMHLVNVSPAHEHDIECFTSDSYQVFTADGNIIKSWIRGTELKHTFVGHDKRVHILFVFGPHLISIDDDSVFKVWEIRTAELYTELSFSNSSFRITTLVHPATYINKVLLGSQQGTLQLWNLKSSLLIYTFKGWNSPVTVLEQVPAIDVIAVGLEDGRIYIHNFKYDETIVNFVQDWGPITALSFRTDGHPILASSGTQGHIGLWNLEDKKLQSQIRDAHVCAIAGMRYLPEEPLLITNSSDNTLKMWIFDLADGGGRILRQREGHCGPPTRIRFYGNDGEQILSAGEDSCLRRFSVVHGMSHKNFGQASFDREKAKNTGMKYDLRKMPPIIEFSAGNVREKEWDNIAAIHADVPLVTTWSSERGMMADRMLKHHEKDSKTGIKKIVPTCLTLSSCGNFLIVGYKTGHVDMFNIQSGIYRGRYGKQEAHKGAICGVATDILNQVTVTAGMDKIIKFWRFKTKELLHSMEIDAIANRFEMHRESGMLGIAFDDFTLQILDMDTKRIVRKFDGHSSNITDFSFSGDGRWLVSTSMDCSIRTWDIPSARLIDCFLVDEICTSLTLSPTGEYLATAHVNNVGIYLWVNRTLYTHVSLRPLPSDYVPQLQTLPAPALDDPNAQATSQDDDVVDIEMDFEVEFKSPEQISKDLVTLSLAPESRWRNLLNLDIIKKRNKPKDPPKKPKAAPFFLPTISGLEFKFALPEKEKNQDSSRLIRSTHFYNTTEFGQKLEEANSEEDYITAMEMLKKLSSAAIEVEMNSLPPEGGGSLPLMLKFLHMVNTVLKTNRDFEVVQAYLGLFVKLHGSTISEDEELMQYAKIVLEQQTTTWERIQTSLNRCECIVSFLKNAIL